MAKKESVSENLAPPFWLSNTSIIEREYKRACEILRKNKGNLIKLAERLLDKEVIFKDDLTTILGKRPFETEANSRKSSKRLRKSFKKS